RQILPDNPLCYLSTPPFTIRSIAVHGPDAVALGEDGNGDAVVGSDDAGAGWSLRDAGLAGHAVTQVASSAGGTKILYALHGRKYPGSQSGTTLVDLPGLAVSPDAGGHWREVQLPVGARAVQALHVDPQVSARLWILVPECDDACATTLPPRDYILYESP